MINRARMVKDFGLLVILSVLFLGIGQLNGFTANDVGKWEYIVIFICGMFMFIVGTYVEN